LLHSYARRPTVCIESLMQLLRVVEAELPRVTAPALITHGRGDRTVDVGNAPFILANLGSVDKQLVWFESSAHTPHLEEPARFRDLLMNVRASQSAGP